MIDLQMHSNFSDGSQSPSELVNEAKSLGLRAIALTDHDTVDGLPEFMNEDKNSSVITVPGVEISVDTKLPNNGHMHILGLFIDYEDQELKSKLDYLKIHRNERAEKIIKALGNLGIEITLDELFLEAGEVSIGRPHIAKILLRKKVVSSIQEAFERYLAKGKPAYVEKVKFGEQDAIRMIKDANGLAILAHPHLMHFNTLKETTQKILSLRSFGLDGIEVYYPGLHPKYTELLQLFALENDLALSGGSDYHGKNKDGIKMGTGKGYLFVPDQIYSDLKERWENGRNAPVVIPINNDIIEK